MRDGIVVPQLRQEECIDIMVNVLSSMELHLNAAKGYLRAGMAMDLGGIQDQESVREAGAFLVRARDACQKSMLQSRRFGRNTSQSTQLDRG